MAAASVEAPEINRQLAGNCHDGLLACGASSLSPLGEDGQSFAHGRVSGLEADQSPGEFDQAGADPGIAVLGDAALDPLASGAVLSRAEAGVTGNLPTVLEAGPVADFPAESDGGEFAEATRDSGWRCLLELLGQDGDLAVEFEENGAVDFQEGNNPGRQMRMESVAPRLRLPPVRRGGQAVRDQEAAPGRFQFLAVPNQLLALTGKVPLALLFFARHPDDRQFPRVAIEIARETLAERLGIAPVGLYPSVLFVEFARCDNVAMRAYRPKLAVESEAEAAGLIDNMHGMPRLNQPLDPRNECSRFKALRRLRQRMIVLCHDDVETRMVIQAELDRRGSASTLCSGGLE